MIELSHRFQTLHIIVELRFYGWFTTPLVVIISLLTDCILLLHCNFYIVTRMTTLPKVKGKKSDGQTYIEKFKYKNIVLKQNFDLLESRKTKYFI